MMTFLVAHQVPILVALAIVCVILLELFCIRCRRTAAELKRARDTADHSARVARDLEELQDRIDFNQRHTTVMTMLARMETLLIPKGFAPGDVVRHKTGGPLLVVMPSVEGSKKVQCRTHVFKMNEIESSKEKFASKDQQAERWQAATYYECEFEAIELEPAKSLRPTKEDLSMRSVMKGLDRHPHPLFGN